MDGDWQCTEPGYTECGHTSVRQNEARSEAAGSVGRRHCLTTILSRSLEIVGHDFAVPGPNDACINHKSMVS